MSARRHAPQRKNARCGTTGGSGEHSLTFDDLRDLTLVRIELERRQEAQRAQVEGHDRGDALLQENTHYVATGNIDTAGFFL